MATLKPMTPLRPPMQASVKIAITTATADAGHRETAITTATADAGHRETNATSAAADAGQRETNDTTATADAGHRETSGTSATEKHAKNTHFSPAKATRVSTRRK